MKYILAISLLFLSACKSGEDEGEKACEGDAAYDSINGNWRLDYRGSQLGLPHMIRLRFKTTDEEVYVEYTCGNGYGDMATSVERTKGIEDDWSGHLSIAPTGVMQPKGRGFSCQPLNFGGNFTYAFAGTCLLLKDGGNGTMKFKKGL